MKNSIQVFKHEMFGEIRTLTNERCETFFVGKDVAKALGYNNTTKAIRDHVDKEDKLEERFVLSGQNRKVILINESFSPLIGVDMTFNRCITAKYSECGYAEERMFHYYALNGERKQRAYLVWTPQGKVFLNNLINSTFAS